MSLVTHHSGRGCRSICVWHSAAAGCLVCSLPAVPAMALVLCLSSACPSTACMALMMLPPFSRQTRYISITSHRPFLRKAPRAICRLLASFSFPSCELHVLPVVLTSRQPTPHTGQLTRHHRGGGGWGADRYVLHCRRPTGCRSVGAVPRQGAKHQTLRDSAPSCDGWGGSELTPPSPWPSCTRAPPPPAHPGPTPPSLCPQPKSPQSLVLPPIPRSPRATGPPHALGGAGVLPRQTRRPRRRSPAQPRRRGPAVRRGRSLALRAPRGPVERRVPGPAPRPRPRGAGRGGPRRSQGRRGVRGLQLQPPAPARLPRGQPPAGPCRVGARPERQLRCAGRRGRAGRRRRRARPAADDAVAGRTRAGAAPAERQAGPPPFHGPPPVEAAGPEEVAVPVRPRPSAAAALRVRAEHADVGGGALPRPPNPRHAITHPRSRAVLQNPFFFVKDSPQGPPTANRQSPPAATRHQPPPANRHRPSTTNRQPPPVNCKPPTANNRHPRTATNRQPQTANHHQPSTANRQPPTTANRGRGVALTNGRTICDRAHNGTGRSCMAPALPCCFLSAAPPAPRPPPVRSLS